MLADMFIHNVFFWLKVGTPAGERQALLRDCREMLSSIPGVRHLWAGEPALTPRTVVDNSYDVGLCVVLEDAKAHDVYQEHPKHKEFAARHKDSWARLQVYDIR